VRLLVTGADGQIGWELRRSLMPLGEVTAMGRKACDLSRLQDLPRIIREAKPDIIVNAAAYTAVDKAEVEEPLATLINGAAVGVIADEARKCGALLIHYSTDYVFDGTKTAPYTEDDSPHPLNAYGRSKLAGERAIEQCGGNYLVLRTSWVYAARGRNFLLTVLRLAREQDELRIVSDQIGTPTWAREIADATTEIARQARREQEQGAFKSGLFNVAATGETSWFGFAEAIVDRLAVTTGTPRKKIYPISSRDYHSPAERPKNSRLAGRRIRERYEVGLSDWKEGLGLCLNDAALFDALQ
jgi:dTDP-4-dehydrorhamnose reductase